MRYLLLLYDDVAAVAALGADERRAIVDQHIEFGRELDDRRARVTSEALGDSEDARTIRFTDGSPPLVTDGPFIEAKESLGSFYVLDCADLDEALELAKRLPRSPGLVAELRPIVDV
jgi:hypothetical protein